MVFAAPLNPIFPWGSLAALATVVLILGALWRLAGRYADPRKRRQTRIALAGALFGELLLSGGVGYASFRFAPIAYSVSDRAVIVHARGGRAAVLPLSNITAARVDATGDYAAAYSPLFHLNRGGWRLIGPFGIVAENRSWGLGLVRVFVSDPGRAVVLVGEPPVIVSPADPEAFVAAVNARIRNLIGVRAGRVFWPGSPGRVPPEAKRLLRHETLGRPGTLLAGVSAPSGALPLRLPSPSPEIPQWLMI